MKIEGLITGMAVHFAGCCHPIPGDRIVGIVTTGKGVAVHSLACKALENMPMNRNAGWIYPGGAMPRRKIIRLVSRL